MNHIWIIYGSAGPWGPGHWEHQGFPWDMFHHPIQEQGNQGHWAAPARSTGTSLGTRLRRGGLDWIRSHRWAQLGWTMPGQAGLWGAGSCPCCSLACAGSDGPRAGVGSWALSQSQEWPKYRFFEWLLIGLTQYLSWIWAGVAQNDWITTGMANGFYLQQSRVWITG